MPTPYDTNALVAQTKAMLAQTAAEGTKSFKGSSFDTATPKTPVAPTTTTGNITPSLLNTQQPLTPAVTQETPIPDISYLAQQPLPVDPSTVDSTLTQSEKRLKDMTDQLMGINTALEGKNTYTAQQNEALGVNAASDAITGLNSQLTGLINESKAIPLAIQQNAQQGGANVTKGGLAPIQTAQLRNNAIQSLAVSSQIDAMNGQLSNAIKKVDRAVALKYGDLEARSATLTKDLEVLSKDPSLTLEQQDRVAKKLAEQKKYDTALAEQKKVETDTHDSILKTLSNNSGNPKLTQQVTAALQAATTPEEVAALVNYFGLQTVSKADQLDQTYKQAMIDKANYDLSHPNRQTSLSVIGGHQMLIDTNTGATIKDYGPVASTGAEAPTVKTINGIDRQWNPTTQKWEDIGGGVTTPEQTQKSKDQIDLVLSSLASAEKLAGASGRSGARKFVEGALVGSTDYTNLVAETNTLRTNVLTMMTDPAIKKFFGPQMSNADVQLMTSAGTTLNPELQSPEKMKTELARLKDFALRAKAAVDKGVQAAPAQQVEYQGKIYNVDANGDMTPA